MNHYEIVIMIHPDKSNDILNIIDNYISIINSDGGKVHRLENWGCHQLSYPINKLKSAYYILLNIEVSKSMIIKLSKNFQVNDNIIRNIILNTKEAITKPSIFIKENEKKE